MIFFGTFEKKVICVFLHSKLSIALFYLYLSESMGRVQIVDGSIFYKILMGVPFHKKCFHYLNLNPYIFLQFQLNFSKIVCYFLLMISAFVLWQRGTHLAPQLLRQLHRLERRDQPNIQCKLKYFDPDLVKMQIPLWGTLKPITHLA